MTYLKHGYIKVFSDFRLAVKQATLFIIVHRFLIAMVCIALFCGDTIVI
jgi:hypothetical protein